MTSLATTRPDIVPADPPGGHGASALWLAGLAALLASSCCVLPLVFVLVGVSGAWIGYLTRLEPYSIWLDGLALAALGLAAWRIYRPRVPEPARGLAAEAAACAAADAPTPCASARPALRAGFWFVVALTLLPIVVPLLAPLFY